MPRGNAARAFGTCLTASRCQDGPVSFHEFTKYDRFRHVSRANGETWTVNIERGNAFQGWSWFNSLYDEWGGSTVLIAAIVDWPSAWRKSSPSARACVETGESRSVPAGSQS